jgi:CheY-like chemotaxis protein
VSYTRALLIVEDDIPTRMLLEVVALRNQFRPVLCGDGRSALRRVESDDFDVILLDMRLPELDGFVVLERLAFSAPQLLPRVIIVTAISPARLRASQHVAAVWRVLRKPFELDALQQQILDCAANRRAV